MAILRAALALREQKATLARAVGGATPSLVSAPTLDAS